jgi:hypothetical protein
MEITTEVGRSTGVLAGSAPIEDVLGLWDDAEFEVEHRRRAQVEARR